MINRAAIEALTPVTDATKFLIIAIPFAGGSPSAFHPWKSLLPSDTSLISVWYPGRNRKATGECSDARELAVAIALAVESYLGGVSVPYALYGHSFGCLLSFLVINELNRRSVRLPAMYVAAAGRPPCVMEGLGSQPPIRNYTVAQMKQVMEGYGHTPGAQRHWCGNPSGSHWIDEILNNEAMLDFFSKPVKADLAMLQEFEYRDDPPVDVPIHVYTGAEDERIKKPIQRWSEHTNGSLYIREVDGGHFFLSDNAKETIQLLLKDSEKYL